MKFNLKYINKFKNIEDEDVKHALDNGVQVRSNEPILIYFEKSDLPSNINLGDSNALLPFVQDQFEKYFSVKKDAYNLFDCASMSISELIEENGVEIYLKERLTFDYLKNFIYPYLVNIDLINLIIKLEINYSSYYQIEIFKQNRKDDNSILFFILNGTSNYFYKNENEMGFCNEHGYSKEQLNCIFSFLDYMDYALEFNIIEDKIIPIASYAPREVGFYEIKKI